MLHWQDLRRPCIVIPRDPAQKKHSESVDGRWDPIHPWVGKVGRLEVPRAVEGRNRENFQRRKVFFNLLPAK